MFEKLRIAIVSDWLVTYAGAERVLSHMIEIFPCADLFAVVDFLKPDQKGFIQNKPVKTTFIQKLPFAKKHFRKYLSLMPLAIESLDLSQYDLIISSSHAVAKGVLIGPDQLHISYIHSPMRYAWDLQHQYLQQSGLSKGLKGWMARRMLHRLRTWDVISSYRVDHFISNSDYIGRRIEKVYRRPSTTIHCGVDLAGFELQRNKQNYYLTASRMVPYKRMDLIVSAFKKMPQHQLIVIGEGLEYAKIQKIATDVPNIILKGFVENKILKQYMQDAKAFVFAAEEDFGIIPVEAQACGTPVIALGKGGALETIRGWGAVDCPTGVFFEAQTEASLIQAVSCFEAHSLALNPLGCRENAERFSVEKFKRSLEAFVSEKWLEFQKSKV